MVQGRRLSGNRCGPAEGKLSPDKPGGKIAGPSRNRLPDISAPRTGNLTLNCSSSYLRPTRPPPGPRAGPHSRDPYDTPVTAIHRKTSTHRVLRPVRSRAFRTLVRGAAEAVSHHFMFPVIFIVIHFYHFNRSTPALVWAHGGENRFSETRRKYFPIPPPLGTACGTSASDRRTTKP